MKSMSRRERKELLKRWNASHDTTRVLREKKKNNTDTYHDATKTTTFVERKKKDDFFEEDGLKAEEHKKRGWSFSRKENWIGMPDFDERRRKGGNEDEMRYAIRPSSSSTTGSD